MVARWRIAIPAVLMVWTTIATAGDIYRWHDGANRVHYGDRPPAGVTATRLDRDDLPYVDSQAPPPALPVRHPSTTSRRRRHTRRQAPSPRRRCRTYRKRLSVLDARLRRGYREPAGNRLRKRRRILAQRLYHDCYF